MNWNEMNRLCQVHIFANLKESLSIQKDPEGSRGNIAIFISSSVLRCRRLLCLRNRYGPRFTLILFFYRIPRESGNNRQ